MGTEDRKKKSWREVDAAKDRGRGRRVERGSEPTVHRTNKAYKAELDRFFDKGVASDRIKELMAQSGAPPTDKAESPERVKLMRRVRTAVTFDDFVKAVDELRAHEGGLPGDIEVLIRTLEHPDAEAVHEALRKLGEMAKRMSMPQLKSATIRLDSLETATEDAETRALIKELRAKL
jgi:hypothetical protein